MSAGHHHDHAHASSSSSLRSLTIALVLNAAYTLAEVIAAVLAGSLSLLADAGHNLSDVIALAVAAGAVMLARRPATPNRTAFRQPTLMETRTAIRGTLGSSFVDQLGSAREEKSISNVAILFIVKNVLN